MADHLAKPLSAWELPRRLRPVHEHRYAADPKGRERPHYAAVLAFVHRNRFATAAQIRRRFLLKLQSDRTARRHLAELQALGWLGVMATCNTSPLWPKVYFVTRKGISHLRSAYQRKEKDWKPVAFDRNRDGTSAVHVLHELWITEFLLMVWETVQRRSDLELLEVRRRTLRSHPAFRFGMKGRPVRLVPDGMFLFRAAGGMMCCFLEVDTGSMSMRQVGEKLRRYDCWMQTYEAKGYLRKLYHSHGAQHPEPQFRLLIVTADSEKRVGQIFTAAFSAVEQVHRRLWIVGVDEITRFRRALETCGWKRGGGSQTPLFPRSN